MDFLNVVDESEHGFKEIAKKMFENYAIQTADATYRITEMEFYWNSPTHIDNSTYKRKYVNPKNGDWFFHYSGVDIALRNEETGGYGGILLRGVYDINTGDVYKGPMVCAMKLFSCTNAFSESIKTVIVPHAFHEANIEVKTRVGLGDNAKTTGADRFNYAFLIDPKK